MPDTDSMEKTDEQEQKTQPPATPSPARASSIPILLSSLALLLAVFALAATLINSKNMGARQPLDDIKEELSAMESRVNHVESLIATDKQGLVQKTLKKMLFNLHELSRLGDDETRAEIARVEAILLRLSTPATRIKAHVDLKSIEQAGQPDKSRALITAPAPSESEKKSAVQDPQIVQTRKKSPPEHKIESISKSKTTSTKPAETPLSKTASTSPPDAEADAMPASPAFMEK